MYRVESIENADDIDIDPNKTWYRYIITNEHNTITGIRCGTKIEVLKHARLCIMLLNKKYKQGKIKIYKPVFFKPLLSG